MWTGFRSVRTSSRHAFKGIAEHWKKNIPSSVAPFLVWSTEQHHRGGDYLSAAATSCRGRENMENVGQCITLFLLGEVGSIWPYTVPYTDPETDRFKFV